MSVATAQASPAVPSVEILAHQPLILSGISWATYESLLADHIDRGPRFAYDRGMLEIITTFAEHERELMAIALIVETVALELDLDIDPVGSTTFKRQELEQGFGPDASFSIQHRDQVQDRDQIDLATDPPPDLIVEVDITNTSLNRYPIYAGIGVPEVWRYSKGRVTFSLLNQGPIPNPRRAELFQCSQRTC